MNKSIKDIGERALLEFFKDMIDEGDLPFNDDAVAFSINEKLTIVINIDTFVAKTDAPPGMTPYQMGAKATVMAISDLAAKGIQPQFTIASGAFPGSLKVEDTIELVKGIKETTQKTNAKFLGGDTNEAEDIILSVVAVGIADKNILIKRNGAKVGDIICTTGEFGLTGAGFKVYLENYKATDKQIKSFRESIYQPTVKLKEGLFLGKSKKINSCIDSSDGLAWCLTELLRNKTNQGIIIELIPVAQTVIDFAKANELDKDELALFGGEEFELVFTISEEDFGEFQRNAISQNIEIFTIGKISKEFPNKIMTKTKTGYNEITSKGWEHFK
ncbi:MAG TPA: thiamine-phosphate kinase [candidate division Zixibacteria bacterium]|nr:thiamine-phosphate kinase [candidate division Zixibacteria bacterium]